MFTQKDLAQLQSKDILQEQVEKQLYYFEKGFPFLKLYGSASVDKGIMKIDPEEEDLFINDWESYLKESKKIFKFVPASGAASRMFKNLFEFLDGEADKPQTDFEIHFFQHIHAFAFATALDESCLKNTSKSIEQLIGEGHFKTVVQNLLGAEGLNYGALPKGLLLFHPYPDGSRKAVVEHLVEGALYARSNENTVNVHFTVSHEHRSLFEAEVSASAPVIESRFGIRLNISFSEQKPNTDTIAADGNNQPFRDNGKMIFRPGGHGALIENLNDLDTDIVFVKNIDNVVPDPLKEVTVRYKKLIAGVLVSRQKQVFNYLRLLDSGKYSHEELLEIIHFLQHQLNTRNPETKILEDSELALYLKHKLNRPIRVCGMVKNAGEPGGGPFWAYNQDGTISLQILESSQIDLNDPEKKALFEQGTHFNPVDLVCAVKDYKGRKFDLSKFVDKQTGFISLKSKNGKDLKALELPGLWNGAMSDWNTIFVEVPIETFNPVKTVNDLLRPEHQ
ncbi:MAG: DUF4301 family protein [Bacteroidales bacterium]|nr:DUF4301 family protein [Bacteroidales bacterium]